jgi:hypothetical protein
MNQGVKVLEKDTIGTIPYDQTLRAIGQALEPLEIQDFDLEINASDYVVRGQTKTQESTKEAIKKRGLKNALKDAWDRFEAKSLGQEMPHQLSSPFLVLELHFGPEDIDRLERQGKAARSSDTKGATNPYRLSQLLRAVGAYVSRKSMRLLKVSKRKDWVAIEYETVHGRNGIENFRTMDLYDYWVHLFKQRKNQQQDHR